MKVCIEPKSSRDYVVTIVIGNSYIEDWKRYALPSWKKYCEKHDIGLIYFDSDMISATDASWKKATWQKMLIADTLSKENIKIDNVCYLDSDIIISPVAPNIFNYYDSETIGLVSQFDGLHQPIEKTLRNVAFMRHKCYDSKYPLDSALFMSVDRIFEYHGLPPQKNYACMGLIVFNVDNHKDVMRAWFDKYDSNVKSLTGGGDEPLINYEIQNWGRVSWLPYEFQAIWLYEMAWKYPFLYCSSYSNEDLVRACIESSLASNHFLHFAGSWYESEMWKIGGFFDSKKRCDMLREYNEYIKTPVTGEPKGVIKPDRKKDTFSAVW